MYFYLTLAYWLQFLETKNELEALIDNLKEKCSIWDPDLPVVYGITPTYARPVQKAELTRYEYDIFPVQLVYLYSPPIYEYNLNL